MKESKIIEANKLIAEFTGGRNEKWRNGGSYAFSIHNHPKYGYKDKNFGYVFKYDELKFHSSWDWFMPAYRKAKDYLSQIKRPSKHPCCGGDAIEVDVHCAVSVIDIDKAFISLVELIKWINKYKKLLK